VTWQRTSSATPRLAGTETWIPESGEDTPFPADTDYCHLMDGCHYSSPDVLTLDGLVKNGSSQPRKFEIAAVVSDEVVTTKTLRVGAGAIRRWQLLDNVERTWTSDWDCEARVQPS
jgi:hypothetical protein